ILLICHGKQKMNKHYNSRRALNNRPYLPSLLAYFPWWSPPPPLRPHGKKPPRQAAIARFLIATQILELSVSYRKQTTAPHSNRYFFRLFRIPPAHLNRPAPITNPNCRPPLRSSGRTNDSAALCIREVAPSRTAKFPGMPGPSRRMPRQKVETTASNPAARTAPPPPPLPQRIPRSAAA